MDTIVSRLAQGQELQLYNGGYLVIGIQTSLRDVVEKVIQATPFFVCTALPDEQEARNKVPLVLRSLEVTELIEAIRTGCIDVCFIEESHLQVLEQQSRQLKGQYWKQSLPEDVSACRKMGTFTFQGSNEEMSAGVLLSGLARKGGPAEQDRVLLSMTTKGLMMEMDEAEMATLSFADGVDNDMHHGGPPEYVYMRSGVTPPTGEDSSDSPPPGGTD